MCIYIYIVHVCVSMLAELRGDSDPETQAGEITSCWVTFRANILQTYTLRPNLVFSPTIGAPCNT